MADGPLFPKFGGSPALGGLLGTLGSAAGNALSGRRAPGSIDDDPRLREIEKAIEMARRNDQLSRVEFLTKLYGETREQIIRENNERDLRAMQNRPVFFIDQAEEIDEEIMRKIQPGASAGFYSDVLDDVFSGAWGTTGRERKPEKVKTKDFKNLPAVALPKHLLQGARQMEKSKIDERVKEHLKSMRRR